MCELDLVLKCFKGKQDYFKKSKNFNMRPFFNFLIFYLLFYNFYTIRWPSYPISIVS